ncbi:MAG: mandelate racemase/muconate lactonizing enzyme family protein [Halobacteriaceae archaeon]
MTRIASVAGHACSSPIDPPQERPFHGGVRHLLKRDFVLVVVETADGEVGYAPAGASSSAMREYFEDASQRAFAEFISGAVADALEGTAVDDPRDVHDALANADLGAPESLETQAASALDVALHDVRGKELGAPVYDLIADDGADVVTELPLYASAGMYMDPSGYAAQGRTISELGFVGYKYRPGIGPAADRRTLELLAGALGDDCDMLVDAHTWWKIEESYDRETVTDLVETAGRFGAGWVEEPVAPDDYDGYRDLAETGVPLAGGESEHSPEGLIALADTGAVSFLQGDVRHHRGFTGCMRAARHVADTDTKFVPHNFGTLLGLVANAHLTAGAPGTDLLEYPVFEDDPHLDADRDPGMYPFEAAFEILETDLDVADGRLVVPDGPGLGVEVDESVVERYPFREGPWTEFRYDEPGYDEEETG